MTLDQIRDQFGALVDLPDHELSSVHVALKSLLWALEQHPEVASVLDQALCEVVAADVEAEAFLAGKPPPT